MNQGQDSNACLQARYEHLLTPRQVASWLGVSERWVRDHATRRMPRIPSVKRGSLLRFRHEDIEGFIIAQRNDKDPRRER
jgi:excisionase family DNA binding protein